MKRTKKGIALLAVLAFTLVAILPMTALAAGEVTLDGGAVTIADAVSTWYLDTPTINAGLTVSVANVTAQSAGGQAEPIDEANAGNYSWDWGYASSGTITSDKDFDSFADTSPATVTGAQNAVTISAAGMNAAAKALSDAATSGGKVSPKMYIVCKVSPKTAVRAAGEPIYVVSSAITIAPRLAGGAVTATVPDKDAPGTPKALTSWDKSDTAAITVGVSGVTSRGAPIWDISSGIPDYTWNWGICPPATGSADTTKFTAFATQPDFMKAPAYVQSGGEITAATFKSAVGANTSVYITCKVTPNNPADASGYYVSSDAITITQNVTKLGVAGTALKLVVGQTATSTANSKKLSDWTVTAQDSEGAPVTSVDSGVPTLTFGNSANTATGGTFTAGVSKVSQIEAKATMAATPMTAKATTGADEAEVTGTGTSSASDLTVYELIGPSQALSGSICTELAVTGFGWSTDGNSVASPTDPGFDLKSDTVSLTYKIFKGNTEITDAKVAKFNSGKFTAYEAGEYTLKATAAHLTGIDAQPSKSVKINIAAPSVTDKTVMASVSDTTPIVMSGKNLPADSAGAYSLKADNGAPTLEVTGSVSGDTLTLAPRAGVNAAGDYTYSVQFTPSDGEAIDLGSLTYKVTASNFINVTTPEITIIKGASGNTTISFTTSAALEGYTIKLAATNGAPEITATGTVSSKAASITVSNELFAQKSNGWVYNVVAENNGTAAALEGTPTVKIIVVDYGAPTIKATPASIVKSSGTSTLSIESDPSATALPSDATYTWSVTSGNGSLSSPSVASPTFTAGASAGKVSVQCVIKNAAGDTTIAAVTGADVITITEAPAPTISLTASSSSITSGGKTTLTINAAGETDLSGATFTWTQIPAGWTPDSAAGKSQEFTAPTVTTSASYAFKAKVTVNGVESEEATCAVTVTPASPPTTPTSQPTVPTSEPTTPTSQPSSQPTSPTSQPTTQPTSGSTYIPTVSPITPGATPTSQPSSAPSSSPSANPSGSPTASPSESPSAIPSGQPTASPTAPPPAAGVLEPNPDAPFPSDTPGEPPAPGEATQVTIENNPSYEEGDPESEASLVVGIPITPVDEANAPEAGTTVADIGDYVQLAPGATGTIEVVESSTNDAVVSPEKPIATGMIVKVIASDGSVTASATIVVKGDVLGTGVMSISQIVRAAKAINGTEPLEGVFLQAGKLADSAEGGLNIADLVRLARMLTNLLD